jgi:hypothetical protein
MGKTGLEWQEANGMRRTPIAPQATLRSWTFHAFLVAASFFPW